MKNTQRLLKKRIAYGIIIKAARCLLGAGCRGFLCLKDGLFDAEKFIYQILGIVNLMLVYPDIHSGEYGWALLSGASALLCYFMIRIIDCTEIK